jgi:hypothetical protein
MNFGKLLILYVMKKDYKVIYSLVIKEINKIAQKTGMKLEPDHEPSHFHHSRRLGSECKP